MSKLETYTTILSIIEDCEKASSIDGKKMSIDKAQRFAKLTNLAENIFNDSEMVITPENISDNTKPSHSVTVSLEEFEVNDNTKYDFVEMVRLADTTTLYGDEEDRFHISFYVNGIWE